jgi:hypothetical protein
MQSKPNVNVNATAEQVEVIKSPLEYIDAPIWTSLTSGRDEPDFVAKGQAISRLLYYYCDKAESEAESKEMLVRFFPHSITHESNFHLPSIKGLSSRFDKSVQRTEWRHLARAP